MNYSVGFYFRDGKEIWSPISDYKINEVDWDNVIFITLEDKERLKACFIVAGKTKLVMKNMNYMRLESQCGEEKKRYLFESDCVLIFEGKVEHFAKMLEFVQLKRKYLAPWRIDDSFFKYARKKGLKDRTSEFLDDARSAT